MGGEVEGEVGDWGWVVGKWSGLTNSTRLDLLENLARVL